MKKLILLLFITPLFGQLNDTDMEITKQEQRDRGWQRDGTKFKYVLLSDSVSYNRDYERDLYLAKKTREAREKRVAYRKWVVIGGVAIVSYYVGYASAKEKRKKRYPKGFIGDKDYGK